MPSIVAAFVALVRGVSVGIRGRERRCLPNVSFAVAMTGLALMQIGHALILAGTDRPGRR